MWVGVCTHKKKPCEQRARCEQRVHKKRRGKKGKGKERGTTNDNNRGRGGTERRADGPLGGGEAKDAGVSAVLREERVELRKAGGLGLRQHERRLHAEGHLGALAAWEEGGLRLRYHASRVHAGAPIQTLTHAAHTLGKGREKRTKSQSCHNSSIQKRKIGKGHSAIRIDALTHLFFFFAFSFFPLFFLRVCSILVFCLCGALQSRGRGPVCFDLRLAQRTSQVGNRARWAVPTARFSPRRWRRSARSCRSVWDSRPHAHTEPAMNSHAALGVGGRNSDRARHPASVQALPQDRPRAARLHHVCRWHSDAHRCFPEHIHRTPTCFF